MEIVNYSEARENLKQVLDRVSDDCDSILIKRRDHEDIVLLSKSHYDSIMETLHLMRSPANAQHLMEAIARDQAREGEHHKSIDG
ncbi:MAG: type II toxin-antitoxin system Phd/YefM family antitoxin [Waterburya sp.]